MLFVSLFSLISISIPQTVVADSRARWQNDPSDTAENTKTEFLQQFISNSLDSAPSTRVQSQENRTDQQQTSELVPDSSQSNHESYRMGQSDDLFVAAIKMVIALGAIIILLVVVSFFLRRYISLSQSSTKQEPILKVVSKVPLTTKSLIALVEVHGKHILVGVSGSMIAALGEICTEEKVITEPRAQCESQENKSAQTDFAQNTPEELLTKPFAASTNLSEAQSEESPTKSFAASLEQYTKLQSAKEKLKEQPKDNILTVQEAIQQKVSGLKRL